MKNAKYLEVRAEVRFWEDTTVNGIEDTEGFLIPLRRIDGWHPVIELATGRILDWPQGVEADIHYKVCDQGEYWLQDERRRRIAKWRGSYVPDDLLSHGDDGYGDYIIMRVDGNGMIDRFPINPTYALGDMHPDRWRAIEPCPRCDSTGWVCESHGDKPMHGCCGDAGAPCPDCMEVPK